MFTTIQCLQYPNFGSAGVGASGSMSIRVYECSGVALEMEMRGCSETWVTRAREPLEGEREGKDICREMEGVNVEGIIGEGRREAERRDSMSEGDILDGF